MRLFVPAAILRAQEVVWLPRAWEGASTRNYESLPNLQCDLR
jgi:hypothetical protein